MKLGEGELFLPNNSKIFQGNNEKNAEEEDELKFTILKKSNKQLSDVAILNTLKRIVKHCIQLYSNTVWVKG